MTERITLLMLSKLGAGDGGRETWLANFLDEIARQNRDVVFDVIHQEAGDKTLLDAPSRRTVVARRHQVKRRWTWCPTSVEFLMRLAFSRWRLSRDAPILAVGGLAEALGALLLDPWRGRQRRMMWLRSIYTREKSAHLPGHSRRLVEWLERYVLGCFGLVVANGEDTAAFYRERGVDCHVIANSVPLDRWQMAPVTEDGRLRVSFIGRLAELKGIEVFLEAVKLCEQAAEGRCLFQVAGDGPARTAVEALSKKLVLVFHGQVDNDDVRAIVCDSDLCVALTLSGSELGGGGVSNALVEQMAAGRILVAWDNDIFRHVLDESMAFLVPQGDPQALADVILRVASDRSDALERAERARERAADFGINAHVDRFFALLDAGKRP